MFTAPLRFQRTKEVRGFGLCDCCGLWIESDFVCGLEEVLRDGGHDHLRMCFGHSEVTGAVQAKEALHCAEALLDTETMF